MNGQMPLFRDRFEAGRRLAGRLQACAGRPDVLVLGLPRGGALVAFEIARRLNVRMDIFLVRKLGVPGHEELAMGAIASGGVRVINDEVVGTLGIGDRLIEAVAAREQEELQRRERVYRRGRPMAVVQDRQAILVDDGLATGATMRAAVDGLRMHRPSRIIVAVPVGPVDTCRELRRLVDEMVCLQTPEPFGGVGAWYEEFGQVADTEVAALLEKGARLPFQPDREGGPAGGAG